MSEQHAGHGKHPPHEPETVDEQYLAERFQIPRATWQDWRYRGKGPPFFRLGRRLVRYRLADVRAWLDSHRQGGTNAQ